MSLTVNPVEQLYNEVKEFRKAAHSVNPLFLTSFRKKSPIL